MTDTQWESLDQLKRYNLLHCSGCTKQVCILAARTRYVFQLPAWIQRIILKADFTHAKKYC